jgi:hypothetical protein
MYGYRTAEKAAKTENKKNFFVETKALMLLATNRTIDLKGI